MIAFAAISVVLTLAVLAIVMLPLLRGMRTVAERGDFDRAVYRDQLEELDRDLARGLIGEREAKAARVEIQRRLLATDASTAPGAAAPRRGGSPRLALAVSVLVAIGGAGLYLGLGSPTLRDTPFAGRTAQANAPATGAEDKEAPHADTAAAARQLEEKLKADPANRDGWELYARTEAALGDWKKALAAFRQAIDLGAKGADVYESYGEMQVLAAAGVVSPAARDAFMTALQTDPKTSVARYYLALADSQAGEARKAIDAWLALAAEVPNDSQMHAEIGRNIASAAQSAGIAVPPLPKGTPGAAQAESGPTPEQVANAADMPPAERDKMIRDMIAKLAARMQAEPNNLDGWVKLGQAYAVLGDTKKAVDAFDQAIRLKPDDLDIKLRAVSALLSQAQAGNALPTRAVALLQEVATLKPEEPEVLWDLGIVAARSGREGEARQTWTRLLTALPKDGEDYKTVQAALAELKGP